MRQGRSTARRLWCAACAAHCRCRLPQSAARIASWLKAVTPETVRSALTALIREYPQLSQMLDGVAEAAPFLFDLIQADAARFVRLLDSAPDEALAAVLADARAAAAAASEQAEVMRILRRMKADAALLIALADIGNVWPVARVTAALTEVAETALRAAVRFLLREAARREKLKPADPDDPEAGSGYIVLAMGKIGGHELNYSSDIDLMVFFARGTARARARCRARPVLCAADARSGQNSAGAHAGRLCVPRRSAAAARSVFDPGRDLDRGRARLLRTSRPELGARGVDQGARLRRRSCRRREIPRRTVTVRLAQISRLRDHRPCP